MVRTEGRTAGDTSIEETETTVGHTEDVAVTASITETAASRRKSYVGTRGIDHRRVAPARKQMRTAAVDSQSR